MRLIDRRIRALERRERDLTNYKTQLKDYPPDLLYGIWFPEWRKKHPKASTKPTKEQIFEFVATKKEKAQEEVYHLFESTGLTPTALNDLRVRIRRA